MSFLPPLKPELIQPRKSRPRLYTFPLPGHAFRSLHRPFARVEAVANRARGYRSGARLARAHKDRVGVVRDRVEVVLGQLGDDDVAGEVGD